MSINKKFSVVDLFSGAGGMSYGFLQTNRYSIVAAFEADPSARETYIKNHPHTKIYNDVCSAEYDDIIKKHGDIDVVIGGPPCQGFSNANRQKNHIISKNNNLVKQYVRAVRELQPKAFVMENVAMLKSKKHCFYVSHDDMCDIKKYNIPSKYENIPLLKHEFIFDGLFEILNSKELLEEHIFHEEEYRILNIVYKVKNNKNKLVETLNKYKRRLISTLNKLCEKNVSNNFLNYKISSLAHNVQSYFMQSANIEVFFKELEHIISIQRMLGKANELYENCIKFTKFYDDNGIYCSVMTINILDYIQYILESTDYNYVINMGVLKAIDFGAPQKRERFVMIGVKSSVSSTVTLPHRAQSLNNDFTVRQAIMDLATIPVTYDVQSDIGSKMTKPQHAISELAKHLRDSSILFNHIITKTTDIALERFKNLKQGENFHNLDDSLKTTYTDVKRTQNTVYLRLNYDAPSGTVVNVRKSMWIHPELDRALSVREAARLQTFPDSFIFIGSKDSQYQQVGNAVPPVLAKAIGSQLALLLDGNTS